MLHAFQFLVGEVTVLHAELLQRRTKLHLLRRIAQHLDHHQRIAELAAWQPSRQQRFIPQHVSRTDGIQPVNPADLPRLQRSRVTRTAFHGQGANLRDFILADHFPILHATAIQPC